MTGDFWTQTPRTFQVKISGRRRALEREWDSRIAQAWHVVAFDRTKRLPPLREVLKPRRRGPARRMTTDEIEDFLDGLAARTNS